MNIVKKLTFCHLKENKARSVVTTLGIVVSVAMITAVLVASASFLDLFAKMNVYSWGDRVLSIYDMTPDQISKISTDERIEKIGLSEFESVSYRIDEVDNKRYKIGSMHVADKNALDLEVTGEYEGKLPTSSDEIAVEREYLEKNELDWKVGDKVRIELGDRILKEDDEEYNLMSGQYISGEEFHSSGEKEYTITAILDGNPPTNGLFYFIQGYDTKDGFSSATVDVKLKDLNYKSREDVGDIILKYAPKNSYDINSELLDCNLSPADGGVLSAMIPSIIVILVIIVVASISLIHNAFSMSLSERVRYLGMLASVGATKKQKRGSIFFEGFLLGIIGIPLGIISGIIGISITLNVIGEKIIESSMFGRYGYDGIDMGVVVPVWAVVIIVLLSAFTIYISALIPALKASRITPIDAISQRQEIKVKAKSLKVPKIVRYILGYEGELAYKNQKRNGRKGRVIVLSIIVSMVLFLSVNYFCEMLSASAKVDENLPYQVQEAVMYEDREKLYDILDGMTEVEDYYGITSASCTAFYEELENAGAISEGFEEDFEDSTGFVLFALDDKDFDEICKANNIDPKQFYSGKGKALVMNQLQHKNKAASFFTDKIIGQNVYLNMDEECKIEIAGRVEYDKDNKFMNMASSGVACLYTPLSSYYNNLSEEDKEYFHYSVGIETDKHTEVCEKLSDEMVNREINYCYYTDIVESQQLMNAMTFIIKVLVYGFITLISLITVANIVNTISTGIASRKKEFAMIKSVGMSPKGFRKMIALESALYGIKAVIVAIPISILISLWMNTSIASSIIPFEINIPIYLCTVFVVFILIGITMVYSVHKLKNDSIVETLKQDIL